MATYISQTMTTSNQRVNYRIVVNTLSQSIENNSTTMNIQVQAWRNNSGYTTSGSGTCYCRIQGTLYSNAVYDSQKITEYSYTVLFNKDITIPHNADGSCTLNLSSYIEHYAFSTSEQYYSVALPTIPRASSPTLSKTEFNIGEKIIINTNRVSDSFTHTVLLRLANGTHSTLATNIANSYEWQTDDTLYQQCPDSPSFASVIVLKTYNGSTCIGEKQVNFTAKVIDSNPTCSSISYIQTNPTVVSLVGNDQDIILTKSAIKITFSGTTAKNYATIKKYHVQIGEKTFESETNDFTVTDIPDAEKIYGWVEDSRKNDSSDNKKEVALGLIHNYSQPTVSNLKLRRESDVYDNTYLSFNSAVADIIASNSAYYIYWRIKENDAANFGDPAYIVNNDTDTKEYSYNSFIGEFSADKNFNFELIIGDAFDYYTYTAFLQTSKPELSIRNNMVGINCVPITDNGTLQINGTSLLDLTYPIGSIYMSVNSVSPETLFGGKWESINDTFLLCAGNTYPAGSSGGEATHKLEVSEMPRHAHKVHEWLWVMSQGGSSGRYDINNVSGSGNTNIIIEDGDQQRFGTESGSDVPHNNMPPYISVYCWKRVE